MLSAKVKRRLLLPAAFLLLATAAISGGCRKAADSSFVGTFAIGEKVQVGPLVYEIYQSNWRNELGSGGRTPKNRYLFIKVSVTNSSNEPVAVHGFSVRGAGADDVYSEVTEDMDKVDNWFGLLRNVGPSQTEQGWVVFDVPLAAYKFIATEGGQVDEEKYAHIDIPVSLE